MQSLRYSIDSLLGNNQYIVNPDLIFPGQVLIIPDANMQAYVVKPGDTLSKISQQFQVPIPILADINNIADINLLYAGQILVVPKIYTVKAGDTLSNIAQELGVNLTDLLVENNLDPQSYIYVGQTLIVPFRSTQREELVAIENELAPVAARFPGTFFYKGQPNGLRVALTFDDGQTDRDQCHAGCSKKISVPAIFPVGEICRETATVERIVQKAILWPQHNPSDLRRLTAEQVQMKC